MQIDRRSLLLSTLALAFPRITQAADERRYWPTRQWKQAKPEVLNVDPALLAQADQQVLASMPDVTGMVVVRGGYIVHERYFGTEYGKSDPVKVRSVTKSVTGTAIGIAVADGLISSLDATLGELIPDRIPDGADPLTPSITVRNLLTMTAGWQWDIGTDYQRLIASDDWAAYTLSQPVIYQPGTYYAYNSGGSHVLSVILSTVTEMSTADYVQDRIFTPLGIARPTWQQSPQGETVGGFGLELTPRNMAKFGLLALDGGRWEGKQIAPAEYMAAATSYQSAGDTTGYAAYGYQWWVGEAYGAPMYFALGFGSQYIYVAPDRDLVVVVVKGFEDPPPSVSFSRPLIENLILPAAFQGPVG